MDSAHLSAPGSAYRLALVDAGDGAKLLAYGSYDGAVRCLDPGSGEMVWEVKLGGFPFALVAADIDADGRDELLAAAADGVLYALDARGRPIWTFRSPLPLYAVAAGRLRAPGPGGAGKPGPLEVVCGGIDRNVYVLDARGRPLASHELRVLVHRLAVGDFDGDGTDEIFAVDNREQVELLRLRDGRLERVWRRRLTVPDKMRNWENPRGSFFAFSVEAGDLDGDGRDEIAMGGG